MDQFKVVAVTFFVLLFSGVAGAQADSGGRGARPISRTYGFVGTLADIGLYYSQTAATATPSAGNTFDNTTSVYDIKLGYISESHFYIGGLYTAGSDNHVSANRVSRYTGGAGLGYFAYNGFNLRAYYIFSSDYGDYKDGTGYQADLGYAINPTSSFYLGVAVSLREVNYKTNQTIANFESWRRKETYPFITMGFLFY
jgi:hypothetical protein